VRDPIMFEVPPFTLDHVTMEHHSPEKDQFQAPATQLN
jgi:hypothetical protein